MDKYTIGVAIPGKTVPGQVWRAAYESGRGQHNVQVRYPGDIAWDGFNTTWCQALNSLKDGITHLAIMHNDVVPQDEPPWLITMLEEMEKTGADMVSAVTPIKDLAGLTTTGIGDAADPWIPFKRFTLRELATFPETFSAADCGYPGRYLIHTGGCCLYDLRKPVYQTLKEDGTPKVHFHFPRRVIKAPDGNWGCQGESEDWYFSRMLHEAGGKSVCTRKVRLQHFGEMAFCNWEAWGYLMNGDENTAFKWRKG